MIQDEAIAALRSHPGVAILINHGGNTWHDQHNRNGSYTAPFTRHTIFDTLQG